MSNNEQNLTGSGMMYFRENLKRMLRGGYTVGPITVVGDFTISRRGERVSNITPRNWCIYSNSAYLTKTLREAFAQVPAGG